MEIIKKNLTLIIFTITTLIFSLVYVEYIFLQGGLEYARNKAAFEEVGNLLGVLGLFSLVLVYARSVLKMIVRTEAFWKRLEPLQLERFEVKENSTKILILLNKSHAYLGVLAIAFIFAHCYLTGSYLDNLLLQIVLALLLLEGISGFVLKFKYTPAQLKQKSYLIHRKFVLGVVLVILTICGHLILGE